MYDVIIAGSGISAVPALNFLQKKGLKIKVLTLGKYNNKFIDQILKHQNINFDTLVEKKIKKKENIFFDHDIECSFKKFIENSKIPPLKNYVFKNKNKDINLPKNFNSNISYAYGGLAEAWGAGSVPVLPEDYEKLKISYKKLNKLYNETAKILSISGCKNDDLSKILQDKKWLNNRVELDEKSQSILKKYKKREFKGFCLGYSRLALSKKYGQKKIKHNQLELWGDTSNKDIFRPSDIFNLFKKRKNVNISFDTKVIKIKNIKNYIRCYAENTLTKKKIKIDGKTIILNTGVFGNAEIIDSSLNTKNKYPLVTNQYFQCACLNLPFLRKKPKKKSTQLSQLDFSIKERSIKLKGYGSIYTYKSLLSTNLTKISPFSYLFGNKLFNTIIPYLNVVTLFIEDNLNIKNKYFFFKKTKDKKTLKVFYKNSFWERISSLILLFKLFKNLINLGLLPIFFKKKKRRIFYSY